MATDGTFEELIASVPEKIKKLARELRALILINHSNAVEITRLGDGATSYGFGPKKMSEAYVYIAPWTEDYINLGFYRGASLKDSRGLLEGTGKAMRHIKVKPAFDTEALVEYFKDAKEERRKALGLEDDDEELDDEADEEKEEEKETKPAAGKKGKRISSAGAKEHPDEKETKIKAARGTKRKQPDTPSKTSGARAKRPKK